MDAIFTSLGLMFVSEMGDKTQLLALLLAARYRRPMPILVGMVVAVTANHLLAGAVGLVLADTVPATWLKPALCLVFLLIAIWLLLPDRAGRADDGQHRWGSSAFLAALLAFFLAEMGDKTQIATLALAARYHSLLLVMAGGTVGMLLADLPALYLGERLTRRVPVRALRMVAALFYAALGIATLAGW